MSRVAVIGIDGMDSELIERYLDELPNIRKLRSLSSKVQLRSVFPPDSPTAWTSIYTGLNPAKHGVITFREPKSETKLGEHLSKNIAGMTFWDVACRKGRRVCIVFPHMGYPVWEVNGIMVGRTNEVDIREYDIESYPADLGDRYDLRGFEPLTSFPLDLKDMIEPTKQLVKREIELGIKLFSEEVWDLFFMYFSSLDNIEHLFWMYFAGTYDKGKKSNLSEVIPDFYKFYDREVIGRFLSQLRSDTSLLVISDHGHGLRPVNVVNVNEILRGQGYLRAEPGGTRKVSRGGFMNGVRKSTARMVNNHRMIGKMASKVIRAFPNSVSFYTKALPVDMENSRAFLADPSGGLKAYSYAGVRVKKDSAPADEYEALRDSIIDLIKDIREPSTGTPLVEWARRREELYEGPHLQKYPDILFKLRDDWGVGWDIGSNTYGVNLTHKLHSGNHRQNTATFLASLADGRSIKAPDMEMMDLAPTVLDLLGIAPDVQYDGRSILQ